MAEVKAQVWRVDLAKGPSPLRLLPLLDAVERKRAEGFARETDRLSFLRAHAALRLLLAGILKRPPAAIPIGVTEPDGKPRVESHALAGRPLDFSLSHSGRQALVGIAIGTGHIGVDLEARGVPADFRALAQRNFTAEEQRWLFAAPAATQGLRFLQCWTRKEAYLKAIGKGFSRNPSLFRCRIDSDGAVVGLAHDAGGRPQARWQTLPLDESDVAACAVVDFDAAAIRIERFDWKSAAQD